MNHEHVASATIFVGADEHIDWSELRKLVAAPGTKLEQLIFILDLDLAKHTNNDTNPYPLSILHYYYEHATIMAFQAQMPLLKIQVFLLSLTSPASLFQDNYTSTSQLIAYNAIDIKTKYQDLLPLFQYAQRLPHILVPANFSPPIPLQRHLGFSHVALGGTFDHLHVGHLLLLSAALLLSTNTVTIGITDPTMLAAKQYGELIQPFPKRQSQVYQFVHKFRPDVQSVFVRLLEPYGPTIVDASIQAIVVTAETESGALKINHMRQARGFEPLEIVVVDYVKTEAAGSADSKLSSTLLRRLVKGS